MPRDINPKLVPVKAIGVVITPNRTEDVVGVVAGKKRRKNLSEIKKMPDGAQVETVEVGRMREAEKEGVETGAVEIEAATIGIKNVKETENVSQIDGADEVVRGLTQNLVAVVTEAKNVVLNMVGTLANIAVLLLRKIGSIQRMIQRNLKKKRTKNIKSIKRVKSRPRNEN